MESMEAGIAIDSGYKGRTGESAGAWVLTAKLTAICSYSHTCAPMGTCPTCQWGGSLILPCGLHMSVSFGLV